MHLTEAMTLIKSYQQKLGYDFKYGRVEDRMEHIRNLSLALNVEVSEFLEWLPFKPWRDTDDQKYNVPEAALELVDIFFFMTNLWLALGLPVNSFEEIFKTKLEENLSRIDRGYNKPMQQLDLQIGDKGETL